MIEFSFESPLCLLEKSKKYNDYEYALVHLMDKYPVYRKFYEEQILKRPMYLDNSAFELGESFDPEEFKKWLDHFANINQYNLWYMVPDYPYDKEKTLDQFNRFHYDKGHKIGVIQGKTHDEFLACFATMYRSCDLVAIPMMRHLKDASPLDMALARLDLLNDIESIYNIKTPIIHLLGCTVPQEFSLYKTSRIVKSADTSNPILHGMLGIPYETYGLNEKNPARMDQVMEKTDFDWECVERNLNIFRKLAKVD